jgi:transcriptional regulator GlxA family with amidase domain
LIPFIQDNVVVDGQLVTSRGPGTCFQFALALVAKLVSQEVADEVKESALIVF